MNKLLKKGGIFAVFAVFLLALFFPLFSMVSLEAKALTLTRHATVLSSNIYGNTLQVQCKVAKDTESAKYLYFLRYSETKSDFEGSEISESVAKAVISQPSNADFSTVSADVSAFSVDTLYFVVQVEEANLSSGETKTSYTAIREAKKVDLSDADQAYFMDCGSSNLYAYYDSSDADFTGNQSRSWQAFGADPLTGKKWGIVSGYSAAVTTFERSIYGSTLNSDGERMTFRFELDDDTTAYDVVMGFKDQSSSRINSAGDIFVNGDYQTLKGSYVGGYNASTVYFTDVKGVGDGEKGYFLQIDIDKAEISADMPLCNFISIRKKGAEKARFIGIDKNELNVLDGTTVSELPATFDIYTTAGKTTAPVSYQKVSDSKMTLDGKTYYQTTADATVTYGEKEYEFDLKINVWTKENMWYFVDCAQTLPFSSSMDKYEWLKANKTTLLNTDKLDKAAMGSTDWGYFGVEPTVYWGNIDSYASIYEGTDFSITYSFPNLPKGNYVFEMGVTDPWGPRTTRIYINGEQVDYLSTKTLQKAQKTVSFTQEVDGAPVYIKLGGTSDKPLVGWMAISTDANPPQVDSGDEVQSGCGGTISSFGGVLMTCFGILLVACKKKH